MQAGSGSSALYIHATLREDGACNIAASAPHPACGSQRHCPSYGKSGSPARCPGGFPPPPALPRAPPTAPPGRRRRRPRLAASRPAAAAAPRAARRGSPRRHGRRGQRTAPGRAAVTAAAPGTPGAGAAPRNASGTRSHHVDPYACAWTARICAHRPPASFET